MTKDSFGSPTLAGSGSGVWLDGELHRRLHHGAGAGISDFMVLEVLLHKGPLTISAIGEKVLLASASMTSAIDRLEKRGLVRRRSCNSDRRIRIVELTDCGKAFIEEIYRAAREGPGGGCRRA